MVHGVETADIGRLERPGDADAAAKACPHDGIDCIRAGDAAGPQRPGFPQHGKL
jgi:hypothetical protein